MFLSSPGDCKRERDAISKFVSRINLDPLVSKQARVEVVRWDWDPGVPMEALEPPQASVNAILPTPETCEVFVGLFRRRFGTPLPTDKFRRFDGQAFLSGTEYEFHRAWDARRRQYNLPHRIWIFRQRKNDSMRRTLESRIQYERVENFFSEAPFRDGSIWTGCVHPFQAVKDLIQQLENNLRQYLSHVFPIGTLPLDDWCRSEGCSLIDRAGPRYSQDAHVETDIGKVFDWLLARPEAIAEIDHALAEVWKNSQYESAYDTERERLGNVAQSFRQDRLWQDILPAFDDLVDVLTVLERRAWEQADAIDANRAADGKSDHKNWRHRQIAANSRDARDLIGRYSSLTSKRILLLVGPAGQGKTHTLVHEVQRTLKTGGLALGVLCQEIGGTGAVWNDILRTIDYHNNVSSLLDALENESRQRNQRVLIVLDALNQTPQRQRWRDQLIGVIQDILKRPHLVLAFSVRSDYLQQTLPTTKPHDSAPWVQWQHPGFSSMNGAALTRYFAHYGVTAPVAPPIGEIANPLYTQMLAKSMQHGEKVSHWLPSWLNVWKAWIAKLEDDASGRLVIDASRPQPISRTLHQLAQRMLTSAQFCVIRSDADEIAKQVSGVDGVIGFLCSEGALFDSIDSNNSEIIEFSYDRLTDTFLANQTLGDAIQGPRFF